MLDLLFFIKTLAVTVFIVILLQNKIGGVTLEDHAIKFLQTATVVQPIHSVAKSGVTIVKTGISWISQQVNGHLWRSKKTTEAGLGLSRSEAYQKAQAAKLEKTSDESESPSE